LLSGGIENRFISLFSAESLSQLDDLTKISQDQKLLQLMKQKPDQNEEDKLVESIIHQGQNPVVDTVIGYL
jgi:hypothetical protein